MRIRRRLRRLAGICSSPAPAEERVSTAKTTTTPGASCAARAPGVSARAGQSADSLAPDWLTGLLYLTDPRGGGGA
ncbi:hypothetical protein chiPu_0010747 [Chiloscyllium punctatum]|uniref:Uncharacterized protein n=1 Tax=Chiloscyllium punctatum TaxID=137246 RepID=A0A401SPI5_CHIPU|nr:hypothetical protein [Chiloscyllium punctatum]